MDYATDTKDHIFMINRNNSDNKCTELSIRNLLKEYSSFVFLVSMKYLKNEEKSKQAAVRVLKNVMKNSENLTITNIKQHLHTETLKICNE